MMDKQALSRLERFKARLESERKVLGSELETWLVAQQQPACDRLLEQLHDIDSEDLFDALKQLESAEATKIRKRLQAIEASLCQLELGLYGYCADCEQAIEPELLQRDATIQRCKACHLLHLENSKNSKHRVLL